MADAAAPCGMIDADSGGIAELSKMDWRRENGGSPIVGKGRHCGGSCHNARAWCIGFPARKGCFIVEIHVTRAHLSRGASNLASAEARYRQVLGLVRENPEIQPNFATLLGELGHYQEGLEIAGEVLDRNPNSTRAQSIGI